MGAGRFDDQPGVEAGGGHGTGQLARPDVDPAHHAAAAHLEAMVGGDAAEPGFEQVAAPFDIALEIAGAPEMLERGGCGDEGVVVAAEGDRKSTRLNSSH